MSSTEVQKWADKHMFEAERSVAAEGPKAYLLGAPVDPLGQIAACAKMYKGEVVRDLADVTNEERQEYLEQIQKTVLKMPLEAVSLHFMLEGVHRGITHQMVRQRTAAYAQESTRFAVKRDMKEATALPPSLENTLSLDDLVANDLLKRELAGLHIPSFETVEDAMEWSDQHRSQVRREALEKGGDQARRIRWDEMVNAISEGYNWLIDDGMPAEEARGIMPTNITTRLNYITNLRSFFDTIAVRVSDQAQFEWRKVAMAYALAMREYGAKNSYWTTMKFWEYQSYRDETGQYGPILQRIFIDAKHTNEPDVRVRFSSEWQYRALTAEMKPIEFKIGGPAFGANFDRPSRIGERVRAFHSKGVPSSQWTQGSVEYGIPPIHPDEWLLDPNSARLESGMEFDIFGNRVPAGTGWHWQDGQLVRPDGHGMIWPEDFNNNAEEV